MYQVDTLIPSITMIRRITMIDGAYELRNYVQGDILATMYSNLDKQYVSVRMSSIVHGGSIVLDFQDPKMMVRDAFSESDAN